MRRLGKSIRVPLWAALTALVVMVVATAGVVASQAILGGSTARTERMDLRPRSAADLRADSHRS